jgi:hypothetical protein
MIKHLSAILVFVLAVMLQLWFAPGGMHGDFVLAALVVLAFLFEFWELVIFILFGMFLLDSSLYPDITMFMFALVPIAVYFMRRRFSFDPWLGAPALIVLGIIVFYTVVAPLAAFRAAGFLALDILACAIFGELILCGIEE